MIAVLWNEKNPMRIGFNCMLLTGKYSGIHQTIWRLAQALHKLDRDNEYVVYAPRDTELDALTGERWHVHRTWFRGKRRLWRILWEQLRLPSLSFKHQLDVVHCPAYVAPNLLVKPTVVTIHDVIPFTHPELCKRSHVIHLKKRLPKTVQNVERIIVPSEATRAALLDTFEKCDAEKIRVIPWGVGDEFRPITDRLLLETFRKKAGLPERFILFVGNREPKKNLEALVKVFYAAVENSEHLAGGGDRSGHSSVRAIPHQLVIVGARGWGGVDAKPVRTTMASVTRAGCSTRRGICWLNQMNPAHHARKSASPHPSTAAAIRMRPRRERRAKIMPAPSRALAGPSVVVARAL